MAEAKTVKKKKQKKNIISGLAYINATFNNTMITITDEQGNSIAWSSAGVKGFKGSRKSTPYACLLYTSPSPRDLSTSRMPSSA